jgi:hypothetical protein
MNARVHASARANSASISSTRDKDCDAEAERSLFLTTCCEPAALWSRQVVDDLACGEGACNEPDPSSKTSNAQTSYNVDMLASRSGIESRSANEVTWWEGTVYTARNLLSTITCESTAPTPDASGQTCSANPERAAQGSATVRSGFQASRVNHIAAKHFPPTSRETHAFLAEEKPPLSLAYCDVVRHHRTDDIMADGNPLNSHERQILTFGN